MRLFSCSVAVRLNDLLTESTRPMEGSPSPVPEGALEDERYSGSRGTAAPREREPDVQTDRRETGKEAATEPPAE